MSKFANENHVLVHPFNRRLEGVTVTIGNMDRQVFLDIPQEGLIILDSLMVGKTVGEARQAYLQRYGETPDIEDYLEALESAGFVEPATSADHRPVATPGTDRVALGGHFSWISEAAARRVCSRPVVVGCGVIVAIAAIFIATDPSAVPGPTVLVFRHDLIAYSLAIFAVGVGGVAIHEMAHLVAARAAGVPARLAVSHRLWILVAETDMTGGFKPSLHQ